MVVRFCLFLLLCTFSLWGVDDVKITSEVENGYAQEGMPVSGRITITYPGNLEVSSFQVDGTPLKVDLVKTVRVSPDNPLTIGIYHFNLNPQPRGVQILPPISARVGGQRYTAHPNTYEVKGGLKQSVASSGVSQAASLQLESFVDGPTSLFPGQRTTVGYRFTFNASFDLQKELLPLLDAKGLRKIGDKIVKDFQTGSTSISEISQIVEAITPGTYTFGPSLISGIAYGQSAAGQKVPESGVMESKAKDVTLTVKAFPIAGKPGSFTGAVGPLTMKVELVSPAKISLGDKIKLKIAFTGPGELENLTLPDLCCLPGFSGLFKAGPLPPAGTVKDGTKTFFAELQPISADIKAVPPIEFSYFDPEKESYVILRSEEIPLEITPAPNQEKAQQIVAAPAEEPPVGPIEILGNYPLTPSDLKNYWFGSWSILNWIPAALLLLFLQVFMRDVIRKRMEQVVPMNSQELLQLAATKKDNPKEFFYYLKRACMKYLVENNEIQSLDMYPEDLPQTGKAGEIRAFLISLSQKRYSGSETVTPDEIIQKTKELL